MSNYIRFTPLAGALDEQALAYHLEIDQSSIMLDCGWTPHMPPSVLDELKRACKQVDLLLISHVSMEHLGSLPLLVKWGMQCPIYATLPVVNMGRVLLMDELRARVLDGSEGDARWPVTEEDINLAFDRVTALKYYESVVMPHGRCQGIVVTPYAAGHSIGGAVWRVKKDTDDVVYAVDYNHKRERHLNGCVLPSSLLQRPSLLITDSRQARVDQEPRKVRDLDLLKVLVDTVSSSSSSSGRAGDVLLPVDSSARVLELSHMLDQLWSHRQLSHPLLLLTSNCSVAVDHARSMLEWMGEAAVKQFATTRETPFDFRNVKLVHSLQDLAKYQSPRVVMASVADMECGFARGLFVQMAGLERNCVVLTGKSCPGSLARLLFDHVKAAGGGAGKSKSEEEGVELELDLTVSQRVPLEGDELEAHRQLKREEAERKVREEIMMNRKRMIIEGEDDEDDEELEEMNQQLLFYGEHYDYYASMAKDEDMQFFANDSRAICFPVNEHRVKYDDYGECINPDDYVDHSTEAAQLATEAMTTGTMMQIDSLASAALDKSSSSLKKKEEAEVPTKCVKSEIKLAVRCRLEYIDMEGLSDGKSVRTILQHLQPKKIIFIHGSPADTEAMVEYTRDNDQMTNEVFAPRIGEAINVSAASNIYQLRLSDALMSSLEFSTINDYEVAYLHGRIVYDTQAATGDTMELDAATPASNSLNKESEKKSGVPTVDLLPLASRWKGHAGQVVGDAKLTELKKLCQRSSITADFDRGSLIIGAGREIRVQKSASSDGGVGLLMEGPFCREYFRVRKLIYSMHAIV